jgi:hemolysin III
MKIFALKSDASPPAGAPRGVRWNYDRLELLADGVVHSFGLAGGIIAAIILVALACVIASPAEILGVAVYVVGLLFMLALSAAYNLWPVSPRKWWLRRFDHSAIYVLIAATYTPFILQLPGAALAATMLIGVWLVAAIGIGMKLLLPGRFDRLAIVLYLALGWNGIFVFNTLVAALPGSVLWLIAVGGVLYSVGVIFHVWERLRFQNAIWHGFVLLGASCHYTAVLNLVLA